MERHRPKRAGSRRSSPAGPPLPLLALLLLAAFLPVPPAQADPLGVLTVVGEGEVRTAPDVAMLQLGVETFAVAVAQAHDENRRRMAAVLEALGRAGVDPQDVQTAWFSIAFEPPVLEPDGRQPDGRQTAGRYRVSNLVTVTVRRLEQAGALIDAAAAAGANQFLGIEFTLADPKPALARARALAVADARERARQLAEAQGVRLGPVRRLTELAGEPQPGPRFAAAESLAAAVTPVAPGQIVIRARVEAVYRLD